MGDGEKTHGQLLDELAAMRQRVAELTAAETENRLVERALRVKDSAIASAINAIAFADLEGNLTYVNQSFLSLWGYDAEDEVLGRSAVTFWQMEEQAGEIIEALRTSGSWVGELTARRKDDALFDVQLSASMVTDGDGAPISMMASFLDITEHKQAEEQIQGLARFPSENPAPILRIAKDGVILYANEASQPLLERWECRVGQRLPDEWCTFTSDVLTSGSRKDAEVESAGRTFLLAFAPVPDAGYVNAYGIDITKRKRAEEEAARLATVIRQAAECVMITDLDGDIEYVNPFFERLTGWRAAEALGRNPRMLKSGYQDQAFYQEMWDTITSGDIWTGTFINKRKDGTLYHEAVTIFPIQDAAGKIVNYAAVKRDITRRVQMEQALQQRNQELALLNRLGQELTAMLNLPDIVEQLLKAVTEIVGAEGASVWLKDEGKDGEQEGWLLCWAAFHHDRCQPPINLRLHSGQGIAGWVAQHGESVVVSDAPADPRFFPGIDEQTGFRTTTLLAVPLRTRGAVVGVIEVVNKRHGDFHTGDLALVETLAASAAIAVDNSQLVEALRQYTAELEARNEELDAFAHTVAHDLKSPLAHVIGLAEVLGEEDVSIADEELRRYLRRMAQTGRKMNNIIEELLLLSVVRKLGEVEMQPLDMGRIVAEAQQRLAFMTEKYEAEIILPETWPVALGHAPWVEEVWVNYFSNALKYGGQPPRVELGAALQPDGSVRFWVRDNGPGIPAEQRTRLFTPFTRLNQVRAEGHGLGLSIVQRIVEKMGGQVGAESDVGQGSVFYFVLPGAEGGVSDD